MYRALIYFITENETGKSSQAVFYMVTSQNVFLSLESTSMQALCDCQQVRFQRANILNLFLLRLIVVVKGKNNYKLLRSKRNRKTQNNRGNTIGHGKTLTKVVWLVSTKDWKTKDDRSEGITDTPMLNFFFWETFTKEIKQSRIRRKNLTEYKSPWMKRIRKQWEKCAYKNTKR